MTSLLNTPVTRTFDAASELNSLSINNGWVVTGGRAVSGIDTMANTTRRYMLDLGDNWSGIVEADIEIQDQVGLVVSAPSSAPDGGAGAYFGIFYDSSTGGYYFKLWLEYYAASTAWRVSSAAEYVTEAPCHWAEGTQVTFKLGTNSYGWWVSANGHDILWLKASSNNTRGTPLSNIRNGLRLGAWATRANATINRMVTTSAKNRDYPSTITTIFYDDMQGQTGNGAAWDPTKATTRATAPFTEGSQCHTVSGYNLTFNGSIATMIGGDGDGLSINTYGIAYYFEFLYYSGSVLAQMNVNSAFQVAINGDLSGTQRGIQLLIPAAGKAGASYLEYYATAIASGEYIQIKVYPQYSAGVTGYAPYASTEVITVSTGSSINGPWTARLTNTVNFAHGSCQWVGMGYCTPSNAGTVRYPRLRRGPATAETGGGTWPYDYVMGGSEGPGDTGTYSYTAGRPGMLYRGSDVISRTQEAN
jgi:hypothetical protein